MEFYEVEKLEAWYFKIKLPYIDRKRLAFDRESLKYVYAIRRYVKDTVTDYLYQEEVGDGEFIFQIGYASLILNEFRSELSQSGVELLESIIFSDTMLPDFPNLYDYQNRDLKQLVSVTRGLFQCYTSYGKSEIIATLADYIANDLGENVLIVTPNDAALKELRHRLFKRFKIDLDYFDEELNINAINLNGFLRSSYYDPNSEYWKNNFWILADEVENCCSESAMEFYENLPNVDRMYGFSATSDKKYAEPLYSRVPDHLLRSKELEDLLADKFNPSASKMKYVDKINQFKWDIRTVLGRNKYLVGYFGTSAVFKKPRDFDIKLIDVVTTISSGEVNLPSSYEYNEIIYDLFTNDNICHLIESIAFKVGTIFIPMFRLEVIDHWLDNYFKKQDYLVLCICGRGYELYHMGELLCTLTLDEVKKCVHDGVIGLILGTKSAYNALDLPELDKCLLLYSKTANIVLQAIGRTARQKRFEVYNIAPLTRIPTYSSDLFERKALIKEYYNECNIVEQSINENYFL